MTMCPNPRRLTPCEQNELWLHSVHDKLNSLEGGISAMLACMLLQTETSPPTSQNKWLPFEHVIEEKCPFWSGQSHNRREQQKTQDLSQAHNMKTSILLGYLPMESSSSPSRCMFKNSSAWKKPGRGRRQPDLDQAVMKSDPTQTSVA